MCESDETAVFTVCMVDRDNNVGVTREDGSWISWYGSRFEAAGDTGGGACTDHDAPSRYVGDRCCVCHSDKIECRDGHSAYGGRENSPAYCYSCFNLVAEIRSKVTTCWITGGYHNDWHKHEEVIALAREELQTGKVQPATAALPPVTKPSCCTVHGCVHRVEAKRDERNMCSLHAAKYDKWLIEQGKPEVEFLRPARRSSEPSILNNADLSGNPWNRK